MSAAVTAAVAAAEAARRRREEEEDMTAYRRDELDDDWEFKILRSTKNVFRDPQELQRILAEEAVAGWRLVEKFDDARIRLKRRRPADSPASSHDIDPYRTWVGRTPDQQNLHVLAWVLGGLIVLVLALVLLRGLR
jgi:hypothetical protein